MGRGLRSFNNWKKDLFELYRDPELNVKPAQLEKCGGAYFYVYPV